MEISPATIEFLGDRNETQPVPAAADNLQIEVAPA
jgi:hypothetical protein